MSKYKYYHIDVGVFTTQVKLCFDQGGLDDILADHAIDLRVSAFDEGIAETHYISDGREGIVVMLIDLDECNEDIHYLQGVITHEAYHTTCRVFEHIGETMEKVGEEIIAYTIEHIVKQVSKAASLELERRNAREERRGASKQARKSKRGSELQVDQQRDGSAGSDSTTERIGVVRRTEDDLRKDLEQAEAHIRATQPTGSSGVRIEKQRGR